MATSRARQQRKQALPGEALERVTGIEPAFSAWEIAFSRFGDQGKRAFCLVKRCFLVLPRPPNIGESRSVVARRWHENVPWRFS